MGNQNSFLQLLLEDEVLRFGKFKTKSGRMSPYFFNTGKISTGRSLAKAAQIYAHKLHETFGTEIDCLFGPAYKGIPLACATAIEFHNLFGKNLEFCFNRKEVKNHGEGGIIIGSQMEKKTRVVIIEDVLTAGTSIRESLDILRHFPNAKLSGVLVGIDREEKAHPGDSYSASHSISERAQAPVLSIIKISDIVTILHKKEFLGKIWIDQKTFDAIETYRGLYGACQA